MHCKHCGNKIDDDSNFCKFCSGKVVPISTTTNHQQTSSPIDLKSVNVQSSKRTDIKIAKELKIIFKLILYSVVVGIISFPIFYFGVYNAPKYDNFDYSKIKCTGGILKYSGPTTNKLGLPPLNPTPEEKKYLSITPIEVSGLPEGLEMYGYSYDCKNVVDICKQCVIERKEEFTKKSLSSTLLTFVITCGLFILVRYVTTCIRWINKTSKQNQ